MSIECHLTVVRPAFVDRLQRDYPSSMRQLAMQDNPSCNLHKAWHAIHFMLTGTAEEGDEPQGFLLSGGQMLGEFDEEDMEEAPPRLLLPKEVQAFQKALQSIDDQELLRRFDHKGMRKAHVYSIGKNAEEEREFVEHYFKELREFISRTASAGDAILITMG